MSLVSNKYQTRLPYASADTFLMHLSCMHSDRGFPHSFFHSSSSLYHINWYWLALCSHGAGSRAFLQYAALAPASPHCSSSLVVSPHARGFLSLLPGKLWLPISRLFQCPSIFYLLDPSRRQLAGNKIFSRQEQLQQQHWAAAPTSPKKSARFLPVLFFSSLCPM